MPEYSISSKERFVFIDGLRGYAAAGVMLFHLYVFDELHGPLQAIFPAWLRWAVGYDHQWVNLFFFISGFVIAYSLRSVLVTAGSAGNFILRRQIRLDPVYWTCIAAYTLHDLLHHRLSGAYSSGAPTAGVIALNLFYLHDLFGAMRIVPVAWSLCLEVQLYLFYILLLLVIQRVIAGLNLPRERQSRVYVLTAMPLLALSLWMRHQPIVDHTFLSSWFLFAMGVLVCWTMEGKIRFASLALAVGLEAALGILWRDANMLGCAGITGIVYAAIRRGGLKIWLKQGVFQYFGRISYSLYLVHWDVGHIVLNLGKHLTHAARWPAVGWYVAAIAASIGAAHVLNVCVERPAMQLAARFKRQPLRTLPEFVPSRVVTR